MSVSHNKSVVAQDTVRESASRASASPMTESHLAEPPAAPGLHPWHDQALSPASRAELLLQAMTLPEKLAQLGSSWSGAPLDSGSDVGPMQQVFSVGRLPFDQIITDGLGHLTRPFGSVPVDPSAGMAQLAQKQQRAAGEHAARHPGDRPRGVPHRLHRPTARPSTRRPSPGARPSTPTSSSGWPPRSAATCAAVGVHQGLSPVLDVVRDYRWGRVEETMGEDPYLVAMLGARLRARPAERRGHRHAQALRRLLRLPGGPQPRPGVDGPARADGRDPAAVRDGRSATAARAR